MYKRRPIFFHGVTALVFALSFILLNRPEIIIITRLGSVAWYPAVGVTLAVILAISPWYVIVAGLSGWAAGILMYQQPLITYGGTVGSIGFMASYGTAAYILRGPLRIDCGLVQRRDVVRYLAVTSAAAAASTVSGVSCLVADHSIAWKEFRYSACMWFLGDQVAILGVAPFLLIYIVPYIRRLWVGAANIPHSSTLRDISTWRVLEACAQALTLVGTLWVMFGPKFGPLELFYVGFVPIIWIAMRQGIRGVAVGLLALNFGVV